jgi:hypothetical protein
LVLNFKVEGFRHKIYLKSGENIVNCSYSEGEIQDLLEVEIGERVEVAQPEIKLNSVPSNEHRDFAGAVAPPSLMDFDYNCYM